VFSPAEESAGTLILPPVCDYIVGVIEGFELGLEAGRYCSSLK